MKMTHLTVIGTLLLCMFLTQAKAQKDSETIPFDTNVIKGKLPNGLTHYIRRNVKPEAKVELKLVVNTGSVLENEDQQGVAHFLEHMAFNGTKNFPKNELVEFLQRSGVRFGADLNAHTSFDETVYDLPISSKDESILNKGYLVIRDWAGNLLLETSEIDKERGVILEEKRMRQGAQMRMMTEYYPELLNGSIYGKRMPIGKEDIIKTAKRQTFVDFYNAWYRPDNMAVIVVGDIDPAQALAKIKSLFSDLKNPANEKKRPEISLITWRKTDKAAVVTDKENTNNIVQVYIGMKKAGDPTIWKSYGSFIENQLISSIIGGELQEDALKPNSAIGYGGVDLKGSGFRGYEGASLFALVKNNPADAIKTVMARIINAKKYGFTVAEFDRAKKQIIENYNQIVAEKGKTESASFAQEYVRNFLNKEASPGIENERKYVLSYLNNLSLAALNNDVAKTDLNVPAYVLYTATPTAKDLPTEKELLSGYEVAKSQMPVKIEEKTLAKNLIETMPAPGKVIQTLTDTAFATTTYILSNGIKVITKKTDFKNDEILLHGYQWGGLTNFTAREITVAKYVGIINQLGLGNNSAGDVQKMLAGVNVYAMLNPTANNLSVGGQSNVKDFEKMLQVLYLRLTNVNFDKNDIAGIQSSTKQQIGMLLNNPSYKFIDTLNKFKYANSERSQNLPTAAEMDGVSQQEIIALYKKMTADLNGLTLTLVGNIDETTLTGLLEKYVASIPVTGEAPAVNSSNIVRPIEGQNNFTVLGGKEKKSEISVVYYGKLNSFIDRENMSFNLLTDVLQMKTTEKLREEMGGTYSPRVYGWLNRAPVLDYSVTLSTPCAPENTDKLIKAFNDIIAKVANGDVTDDDMLKAKEQRKKSFETQLKTNNFWLTNIESRDMYNTDPKLITTYFDRLADIKKDDLILVAKKYLTGSNVLTAIMNPEN